MNGDYRQHVYPDKSAKYVVRLDANPATWSIWAGEDFSDGTVLLYNDHTGEDFTAQLSMFYVLFEKVGG